MPLLFKKRIHSLSLIFLAAFLCAFHMDGLSQDVTEYVNSDSLKVGDTLTYSIVLRKDQSYDAVIFPDSSAFGDVFELSSQQRFKNTDFKDSLAYTLQFFSTEDDTIPALPVRLVKGTDTTTVYTHPAPVRFQTVLEAEDEEMRPLKPIFDFAAAWWPYLLALLLLGLAAWYLYTLYKRKSAEPEPAPQSAFEPAPFEDPLLQLENTIDRLKGHPLSAKEDFKQFYIQLGDAIRLYFERLYHIPALESTSRELLFELNRRAVDEDLVTHTRRVLNEADMVKFAKFTPSEDQAAVALQKAEAFLNRAREVDESRVQDLRQRHQSKMDTKRLEFELSHQHEEGEQV